MCPFDAHGLKNATLIHMYFGCAFDRSEPMDDAVKYF